MKRLKITLAAFLIITITSTLAACYKGEMSSLISFSKAENYNQGLDELAWAQTKFGIQLFQQILKQNSGENIFISPYSVFLALSMTYNGAVGETKQAMAETLNIQEFSLKYLNHTHRSLKNELVNPNLEVQLNIANSLWGRQGTLFKEDFLARSEKFYKAKVEKLDFTDPTSSSRINDWVSEQTKGKIGEIIDKIDPQAILYLVNAIYFKGKWTKEFDKERTEKLEFILSDQTREKIPMMKQSGEYLYLETSKFQAISLPYGDTKRIRMDIFLPKEDYELNSFYNILNAENWRKWTSKLQKMQGTIVLPRFKLKYTETLNEVLKALGMRIAFNKIRANFGNIANIPPNLYIDKVKHKTFLEVDEKGTEAGAATSVKIRVISEGFNMVVNRPFFLAIRDSEEDIVLFVGSIIDPQ